jgi:hypothetical protein
MGKMNLLKANWYGKVGQTVGAKWKNKSTIRTYTKPANPDTAGQQLVRGGFAAITTFVALFADGIRYKSALDTAGQSVRNAIIKLNKEMVAAGSITKADLLISKGGLQKPAVSAASLVSDKVSVTFAAPTATNFTNKAKLVVVAVDAVDGVVDVFEAAPDAGTAAGTVTFSGSNDVDVYAYWLDYRGSNKVASASVYKAITA